MKRISTYFAAASFCFFFLSLRAMSQTTVDCSLYDNVTRTSPYLSNRDTVLSTLRNDSSNGSYYSNATAGLSPNKIYGMFLCRGDLDRTTCSDCVNDIISIIYETCFQRKQALVMSYDCIVRYSNSSFFTLVENLPSKSRNFPEKSLDSPRFFNQTVAEKLEDLIRRASSSPSSLPVPYFVEDQENVNQLEGSYDLKSMVQCSPDLVPSNCTVCLTLAVNSYTDCCRHAQFFSIITPKCFIRYEITALQPNVTNHGVTKGNKIFGITFAGIMTTLALLQLGV